MAKADSVLSTPPTNTSANNPPGQPMTRDDELGMAWWNRLNERERARWSAIAGNTGRVKDAWETFKRGSVDQTSPVDPTRRRFLAVAAVASAVGAGTLAAATQAANVPQAVTTAIGPDPIYDVIEQHRKAAREHIEALNIHCAFEEWGMQGEKLQEYERLVALTDVAWVAMAEAGYALVNTKPTTLAGILAVCKYME